MNINIYIGYDTTNDGQLLAYEICKKSIETNTKFQKYIEVIPLIKKDLIEKGLYYRENDSLAATEFTYTRFLAPILNNYEGVCVFCDSDFIWECDIYEELMPYIEKMLTENKALCCVQHNHVPNSDVKMDGRAQTIYPRKNWTSLLIFNCAHKDVRNLTLEKVNSETGAWLHRLVWCQDENIMELPHTYNYLVGVYDDEINPKAIHYTDGGPWHLDYVNTEFVDKWIKYLDEDQKRRLVIELQRQKN